MGNKKRKSHDEEFSDSVQKKKKPEADFKTTDFRSLLKTNPNAGNDNQNLHLKSVHVVFRTSCIM